MAIADPRLGWTPASIGTHIIFDNRPLRQPNPHTRTHIFTVQRMSSRGKETETSDDAFDKELLAGLDAEELDYKKVTPIELLPMKR